MMDAVDRVVQYPHRYQLNAVSGQLNTYDIIPVPGTVTEEGTPINRALLIAIQGIEPSGTVFNADGSITETYSTGTLVTTFAVNGDVVETFTATGGHVVTKTTVFNADGSISEVIS